MSIFPLSLLCYKLPVFHSGFHFQNCNTNTNTYPPQKKKKKRNYCISMFLKYSFCTLQCLWPKMSKIVYLVWWFQAKNPSNS